MVITTTQRAGSVVRLNRREKWILRRAMEILQQAAKVETDKHGKLLDAQTGAGAIESYLGRETEEK